MSVRGFIALARGVLDHPVVGATKPFSYFEAWLWLLFEAAWKSRRVRVTNGRAANYIVLERGQLSHSRSYISAAWGWTEKRVRTFLLRLERDRQIALQTDHLQTVITICNYELYQNPLASKALQTGRQTDQQWPGNGPEEKQSNKETSNISRTLRAQPSEEFLKFWRAYPTREGSNPREPARKKFEQLRKSGISAASMLAAAKAYAAEQHRLGKTGTQYVAQAIVWLNQRRDVDYAIEMKTRPPPNETPEQRRDRIRVEMEAENAQNQGTAQGSGTVLEAGERFR